MTPVELGKALGFNDKSEEHRGARPDATTASMHTYGLAVDIKYSQNPWVRGANFTNTLKRAALLISGKQVTQATSEQFFHSLGADPKLTTEQIFEILSQRDRDFRHYLRLHNDPTELKNVLNQRRADGTTGVFDSSAETLDQAVRRWQPLIIKDRTNMRDPKNSPFLMDGRLREPLNGFLNLNKDLVVALRDKACLAWGAVDLGPGSGGSGDVMHFDARVCGLGDRLASVGGNFRVTSGHPCLPCPAAGGSSAATTGELEAEEEESYSEDVTYLEREPLTPTETWIEPEDEEDIYPQEEATYNEEALTNVVFPSGESLPVLTGLPEGKGEDYWDPTGSGNPLLNTGPLHKDKKLSANYTVRELTTSGGVSADVARIDPKLVVCLQKIRDHVGRAVTITSGYRSWKRNKEIYQKRGREPTHSQHCAGRAADIKILGMNGLEIGKAAIDACGPNIGVGLGNTFAHIDVRGYAEAWDYGGVEPRWIKEIKDYQQAKRRQR